MDPGDIIDRLVSQMAWAFSDEGIDPDYIRAIYSALEKQVNNWARDKYYSDYNADEHRGHQFIIMQVKSKYCNEFNPVIVPRKSYAKKQKSLIGKYALIQFLEENKRGALMRLFAWGEIVEVEDSRPIKLYVKISSDPEFAEVHPGLIVEVDVDRVLKLTKKSIQFVPGKVLNQADGDVI